MFHVEQIQARILPRFRYRPGVVTASIQTRRLTMGVADGIVEADGEVIYEVKDMKVALSES